MNNMKKRESDKVCNELLDSIEAFLISVPKKTRREYGKTICMFTAERAAKDVSECSSLSDAFDPISLLDEAKKDITAILDREILDVLGEECVKFAQEKV
jgi:hypothetical protein